MVGAIDLIAVKGVLVFLRRQILTEPLRAFEHLARHDHAACRCRPLQRLVALGQTEAVAGVNLKVVHPEVAGVSPVVARLRVAADAEQFQQAVLASEPALTGIPNFSSAFTPGLAGGGEVKYGLDYLVGEKNAEIVRFNKAGGKIYSNRALTQALGVPFQRTPGGGAAVADGGGDSLGVPFMGAGSTRSAGGGGSLGIPFLKASPGAGGGMAVGGPAGGGPGGGVARSSSLRLSLETQVINGVEYATVEQVREAAAAAAEAGRDSAYDGMRNNPSIQRSLGMR